MTETLGKLQLAFVGEYLTDFNAKAAARRAGYSESTCEKQAYAMLRHPVIQAAIKERMAKLIERFDVTQERVITELCCIAFSDIGEVFDPEAKGNDRFKSPVSSIEERVRRSVKSIEFRPTKQGIATKFVMHDKIKALELLGRYLRMWERGERDDDDLYAVHVKELVFIHDRERGKREPARNGHRKHVSNDAHHDGENDGGIDEE